MRNTTFDAYKNSSLSTKTPLLFMVLFIILLMTLDRQGTLWFLPLIEINICFSCIVLKICLQPVREGRIQAAPGAACGEPSPGRARRRNRQVFAPLFIAIGPSGKRAKRGFAPLKFAPVLMCSGWRHKASPCGAGAASRWQLRLKPQENTRASPVFLSGIAAGGACDAAQSKAGCPPLRYGLGAIFSFRAA